VTAPGLAGQRPYLEVHEGIRLTPSLADGRLELNYLVRAQHFRTADRSGGSFNRLTVDLRHDIPLYRGVASTGPRPFNGPNDCATSASSRACPPLQWSRNRQGTIGLRLLVSTSGAGASGRVPFYLQRTLGGSDLNGERLLASLDDYRYRGPHLIALQQSVEHALWGPLGVFVQAEQGKVALRRGDLGFSGLTTSAAVGLSIRAGGAPAIVLSYAWGAGGGHLVATMDTSLLGGAPRPSLH